MTHGRRGTSGDSTMRPTKNKSRDDTEQVYRYICDFVGRYGLPPGMDEIAAYFEQTEAWVNARFQSLQRSGLVSGFGRSATVCDPKIYTDAKRWFIMYQRADENQVLEDILARLEALRR